MFALIPYDVWLAAAIAVGVELSAIAHHVGLAVVVAIMFGLCAYIVVETISDGDPKSDDLHAFALLQ